MLIYMHDIWDKQKFFKWQLFMDLLFECLFRYPKGIFQVDHYPWEEKKI